MEKNRSEIHTRIGNDKSNIEEYSKNSSIYRRVPATLRKYKFFYILADSLATSNALPLGML